MERIRLTREALYQQIWTEPATKVAARYGISRIALLKVCRKLQVPTPDSGYWQLKAAGKSPVQPRLSPTTAGMQTVHEMNRRPSKLQADGTTMKRLEIEVSNKSPLSHRLAIELKKVLDKRAQSPNHLRPSFESSCLDVRISKGTVERATRIMDTLLRALEARGHRIQLAPPPAYVSSRRRNEAGTKTQVVIGKESIQFHIEEIMDTKPTDERETSDRPLLYRKGKHYDVRPTGRLLLTIDNHGLRGERGTWRDGVSKRVEDYLGEFIEAVEQLAATKHQQALHWEQWGIQRAREEHRATLLQHMQQRSQAWNAANALRGFLEAATARYAEGEPDREIAEMLELVRNQVERDLQTALDLTTLKFDRGQV